MRKFKISPNLMFKCSKLQNINSTPTMSDFSVYPSKQMFLVSTLELTPHGGCCSEITENGVDFLATFMRK